MNFTAKSRYALKIMMDLARHDEGVQHREDIAQRAGIPSDFMDQITVKLKNFGLIESVRGRRGGYRLRVPAENVSAYDIFVAVEGNNIQPVACLESSDVCNHGPYCQAKDAWDEIFSGVKMVLSGKKLSDLACLSPHILDTQTVAGKRECLAPKRRPNASHH